MNRSIKICGNASPADVAVCIGAGVNALGFLVGLEYESADALSAEEAGELIRLVPPFVSTVLVTHRSNTGEIEELMRVSGASHLQLHGPFEVAHLFALRRLLPGVRLIRAIHVTGEDSLGSAQEYTGRVDAILLDTATKGRLGGTGETHDWAISRRIRDAVFPTPVILAGGLRPENVASGIAAVRPAAVDVNSGVSERRGVKSPQLVAGFVRAAREGQG